MDNRLILIIPFVLASFVGTFWFVWQFHKEKRSLWLGISFMASLLPIMGFCAFVLVLFEQLLLVRVILIASAVALLMFPIVLIITLLVSGIQLIRKEGFSLSHMLSLGFNVCYIIYLVVWPMLSDVKKNDFFNFLYVYLSFVFFFTLSIFAMYTVSSFLNLLRNRRKVYQYIIVLGSGLINGAEVTPLLAGRIQKGIEAYHQNPGSRLVLSGGKGSDETIPEGEAMGKYAITHGVPKEDILVEAQSVSTEENLTFSYQLIQRDVDGAIGNLLIVTNRYHVFRALLLSKHLGIQCDGRGSSTKLYFSLNAFVREWIAYLFFWRRKYVIILGSSFCMLGGLYLASWFLQNYL